jgi:hypothetical protein
MKERWKPIKGYEGSYEVSNTGKVRSLDRFIKRRTNYSGISKVHQQFMRGRELRPFLTGRNQLRVNLVDDGEQQPHNVARLVAAHFKPTENMYRKNVVHKDYDPKNNHVSNLRWERPDKAADFMSQGRFFDKRDRRLAEQKVRSAKKMLAKGISQYKIAADLCISQGTVSKIKHGYIMPKTRNY